ncbi:hypothetical protein A3E14_04175 [Candidatus Curtissbacteria bacterium RIFCSPHIGHO2_12_FULL_41_13]|nr:MAG: hypothetical protein A3E14_04175 [Candidatus Curtissbacteria bacterium RIFCSPHIGHO2_12_FULL_41_13]
MIKLVAFDYNGTLVADTRPIWEGVNKVLEAFDIKPVSHKQFLEDFDIPVSIAYKNHGLDLDLVEDGHQKTSQIFHKFYEDRVSRIRTRANTRKVLKFLEEKGVERIVFTNHTQVGVSKQLERLDLEKYLDAVFANSERHHALIQRHKGDKLKDYLHTKKLKGAEVLIVGDTIEEIQIARDLGATVCSITHGNCSTRRLKAAKPNYLIGNLEELIPIINKINYEK